MGIGGLTLIFVAIMASIGMGVMDISSTYINATIGYFGSLLVDNRIEIGYGLSGNRTAYIDLVGDDTYTDFGLRVIRLGDGNNANSQIEHRGDGKLVFRIRDNGSIYFQNTNVSFGATTPTENYDFNGKVQLRDHLVIYSNNTIDVGNTTNKVRNLYYVTGYAGDIFFANDMILTECYDGNIDAMCFLGSDGNIIMKISESGDLKVAGKVSQNIDFENDKVKVMGEWYYPVDNNLTEYKIQKEKDMREKDKLRDNERKNNNGI